MIFIQIIAVHDFDPVGMFCVKQFNHCLSLSILLFPGPQQLTFQLNQIGNRTLNRPIQHAVSINRHRCSALNTNIVSDGINICSCNNHLREMRCFDYRINVFRYQTSRTKVYTDVCTHKKKLSSNQISYVILDENRDNHRYGRLIIIFFVPFEPSLLSPSE